MASFAFELVSPERLLLSEPATEVTVPGVEGEFTVMAQHAPFITVLRPGVVRIKLASGTEQSVYVRGGLAELFLDEGLVHSGASGKRAGTCGRRIDSLFRIALKPA